MLRRGHKIIEQHVYIILQEPVVGLALLILMMHCLPLTDEVMSVREHPGTTVGVSVAAALLLLRGMSGRHLCNNLLVFVKHDIVPPVIFRELSFSPMLHRFVTSCAIFLA